MSDCQIVLVNILISAVALVTYLWFRCWLHKRELRLRFGGRTTFTWWTYYVAYRRAFNREYNEFADYHSVYRGPDHWHKAMELTRSISVRRAREGKRYPFINR